jgi:16S rRNA (cytosine967-C5)-methyltransferase
MTTDPRRNALEALNMLDQGRFHLDHIIQEMFEKNAHPMTHRDRALFTAMVFGVIRWRKRLDWIIVSHSNVPMKKIRPEVQNILRLSLFQIFFLDRIPDSAAVHTAVEMAKINAPVWTVRFVNGLLRNIVRKRDNLEFPLPENDPLAALAVTRSFPDWLTGRWLDRFGFEEARDLCDAINDIPPLTIRTNRLKIDRQKLAKIMASEAGTVAPTGYAPDGLRISGLNTPIERMQPFMEGLFQVQDEAAQLVSLMLQPGPGDTVLDACAGFGGKTAHMAQLMGNSGKILAVDHDPKKLTRLADDMKRLGIRNVFIQTGDLENPMAMAGSDLFDRILMDAPCSGLGVIRRNPDIKWDKSRQDLQRFAARQAALLHHVSPHLKPYGRLVYSVCSMEPEENEAVVSAFLNHHPEFRMVADTSYLPDPVRPMVDERGFFRTFPHRHAMDGFFAACLEKRA